MQPIQDTTLQNYMGDTLEVLLPSGNSITIRDCNGNDDDTLTRASDITGGKNLLNWISGITLKSAIDNGKPTPEQVGNWPLSDKYYATLLIRIHSLGETMNFNHQCLNSSCGYVGYIEEDLYNLVVDFKTGKPHRDNPEYAPYLPKPYINGTTSVVESKLSSGKIVSFNILTSVGEDHVANLSKDSSSRNQKFICRDLRLHSAPGDSGMKITHFGIFSKREMIELTKLVDESDPQFELEIPITCPNCKAKQSTILIGVPDFLFPTSI